MRRNLRGQSIIFIILVVLLVLLIIGAIAR